MKCLLILASLPALATATCPASQSTKPNAVAYCGKFEVNSVPVKIKLVFKSESETDIYGSVYGFDMYCTNAPYKTCANAHTVRKHVLDLDPNNEGQHNCLRKQFEGVDEHMSSLQVFYDADKDRIQLKSPAMPHTYLTSGDECNTEEYKFVIMDESGSTISARRLTFQDSMATTNATLPLHV